MDYSISKETHPIKHYFKTISNIMFYIGMGECWYGTRYKFSKTQKAFYTVWQSVANIYVFVGIINEVLGFFRTDLDEKGRHDWVQFTIAHPLAGAKVLVFFWRKKRFIELMERLVEGTRFIFNSIELERKARKSAVKYSLFLLITIYMALLSASFDAVRLFMETGVPITTEVVFFPRDYNSGLLINILRFMSQIHWYFLMAMMISTDCLVVTSLITAQFKFRNVQLYFNNMRDRLLANVEQKTLEERREEFKKDFVTGIKLHQDALWCARSVQEIMGPIYGLQIFLCGGLIVISLIKLVSAEHNLVLMLANIAYMTCLLALTASYMIPCGDITYEASLVPTAIFHCGWDLVYARSDIRVLAVVTLQCSQTPVYMTAFGVIILSHTNFISLLRSSYSFFSVMY